MLSYTKTFGIKQNGHKGSQGAQKFSAPALEQGLDILEFLSLTDFTATLSEIALGIERSIAEIFRSKLRWRQIAQNVTCCR